MKMKRILRIFLFTITMLCCVTTLQKTHAQHLQKPWTHGQLQVSDNQRFLQHADGTPFFLLGETAWLMPQRLNREEVNYYLERVHAADYNFVQVQVLNAVPSVNTYGQMSSTADWEMPSSTDCYGYWEHMDYIISEAERRGIYVGMVCIWGGLVKAGKLTVQQAKRYGTFLANRYKNRPNIIWIIGGDIQGDIKTDVWEALATTIKRLDNNHLMTFHPRGRHTSAQWWSKAKWIDFHCFQSGHRRYGQRMNDKHYPIPENTEEDNWMYVDNTWKYSPIKPVIDDEPVYEGIPKGLHNPHEELWQASDVRRYAYWSVFAGSCGHTYGNNAIMQFYKPGYPSAYYNNKVWYEALNDPGFNQMKHLKRLMLTFSNEKRSTQNPYFERITDQSIIVENGTKYDRLIATRGTDYLLVYNYTGRKMIINLSKINGERKRLWWMDAATGHYTLLGESSDRIFTYQPKTNGNGNNDGILIAYDATKTYIQPEYALRLSDNLLDSTNMETLGLPKRNDVAHFTIFSPTDSSDHYANGVVMTMFKDVLYCMWQSSPKDEDSDDTWVAYSYSKDKGCTWSAPQPLAIPTATHYCTSGGWLVHGDTLTAFIDTWEKGQEIRGGNTCYIISIDGMSWSKPQPVLMNDGSVMNGVLEQDPYVLPTGRLIGAAHFQPGLHAYPIHTDDPSGHHGWQRAHFEGTDKGKQSRELEPSQYQRPDGTMVMLFRDQQSTFRKMAAFSSDNGETWTKPTVTDIPDARTKQCAGNLPDGTSYMVCCPVSSKQRYPLVLLLSDDGITFDRAILLRSGEKEELPLRRYEGRYKTLGYSYPKATIADGYLFIGYSVNKETVECCRIKLQRCDEPHQVD